MVKGGQNAAPQYEEVKRITATGLCANCRHRDDCGYRQEAGPAVLFCEEFELEVVPSMTVVQPGTGSQTSRSKPAASNKVYKGLCMNCENRETCTYPRPEGGIWHCEEYV